MQSAIGRFVVSPSLSRALFVLFAALLWGACGDDAPPAGAEFTITIVSVEPAAGFIPADMTFTAEVSGEGGEAPDGLEFTWDFGDGGSASGSAVSTHRYEQEGTFTVRVTARQRSGGEVTSEASDSVDIDVYARANLKASVPFVDQRAVRSQDELRVTYDLFNDAAEVPVAFTTGVYLAPEGLIDHSNPPDTVAFQALVAGGQVYQLAQSDFDSFDAQPASENIDLTGLQVPLAVASGQYEVVVYCDDGGVVGEHDEVDNVQFAPNPLDVISTGAEGADLTVTDVRGRPSRSNALDELTIDIEITNLGNQAAAFVDYNVYWSFSNDILEDSDLLVASGTTDVVAADASVEIEDIAVAFDETQVIIGSYFLIVEIDPDDTVDEANESNNLGVSSALVITDEPIPGTDIIPTRFEFDPLTTFLDGSVTMTASVINQGDEATPSQFFCSIYLSEDDDLEVEVDTALDSFNFPRLAANEERQLDQITRVPGFIQPGLYYVFVFCDPRLDIPEADEDNNIRMASERLEISADPEVDLRTGALTLAPLSPANGEEITIEWDVCNDGTSGVGPSFARIRISQDAVADATDSILFEAEVEGVDANTCRTIEATVTARCDTFHSSYNVFAELDITDLVPETDEENNEILLDNPLVITGAICLCETDELELDNNSPATPTLIAIPPTPRNFCDLSMCDANVDWYRIPLERGDTVRVVVTFENERGNLDLTLFAADRATKLDESLSDGDREEVIAFVVPEPGDYLLKVAGRTEQDVNAYCMNVEVTPPEDGVDLIVSGIEISKERPVLGEALDVSFEVINLGDELAGSHTTRIFLSEDIEIDPGTDLLLEELVLEESVRAPSLTRRTVEVTMPGSGDGGERYIGVIADALNDVPGELNETNNTGVSDLFELDSRCFDVLEPNNSLDDALTVNLAGESTALEALLVCSDNRDFYEICGEAGQFLRMRAAFDTDDGDIDMHLYNDQGEQIDRAEGTAGEEFLEVDFLPVDRCYTLEVLVVGRDREVPYVLTIENGAAPPELICSNSAEPNDDFGTAAVLLDSLDPVASDLSICPVTDLDYYRFDAARETPLTIRLVPAEGEDEVPANLRLTLWSRTQRFLASTVSATEAINITTTASGRHYLRVQSLADAVRNSRYQIEIEGLDGIDLTVEDFTLDPPAAELGERVRYTFEVSNTRTGDAGAYHYAVYLSDDPVIDALEDTLLREEDLDALVAGASFEEGNKVTIPEDAAPGQLHFIGVVIDNRDEVDEVVETNNVALLPLQIDALCERDAAEPNDARIDAEVGGDFLDVDLTLCADDIDWFIFEALPETEYSFRADFDGDEGDLDLFAYDEALGELDASEGLEDSETVTFTTPAAIGDDSTVTIYIVAELFGASSNLVYQLTQLAPLD